MRNRYPVKLLLQLVAVLTIAVSSCKKSSTPAPVVVDAKPVTIGLFEYDSTKVSNGILAVYNRILIPISKIGTQTVNYDPIFDTGSTGLTMDADGIVPAGMITSTGFNITPGDSLVVSGITITSHKFTMQYGNQLSSTTEYGNLAYASITIANQTSSGITGITIKKVPLFLYYKMVDEHNNKYPPHQGDIFGVGPGVSVGNSAIASPLSYYSPGTGLTNGFKLATLVAADFVSGKPAYVESLLTLGLTSADLNSSGFIMHPLTFSNNGGYSADIQGTISYEGKIDTTKLLFDTGTPMLTIIEDKTANAIGNLPNNTVVTVKTFKGFTYTYTATGTNNFTELQNPLNTGDFRSIFSINFFVDNEFLTDYAGHQIGLKNN